MYTHVCMYVYIYIHMYVYICIHVCVYVCIYIYIYIYGLSTYVCVYIYIYIYNASHSMYIDVSVNHGGRWMCSMVTLYIMIATIIHNSYYL